ncbi:hypothetical protein HBH43_224000 [Parastagonospora nodorum]|nr:hypothetical protein HBH43_224000 [Parastagonospora nodorum]
MIKFCWTKACLLCRAALKSKHSLYILRCNSFLSLFCLLTRFATSLLKANTISSNSMSQTNVREGYRITTLEVVELVEDLTSYIKKKDLLEKIQLEKKDLSNTLTLTLSKTAQRRSLSVVSNRSTALITDKFGVASLTKPAILNDANIALVDAVHHSVVIDALTMTLIEDDDDLLGTVNSHIKLRRLGARCKTEAADSRHAKVSGGRTKKDKDSEDSDTSSDVLRLRRRDRAAACAQLAERKRLGKEAQLKKTRDEEELAKAKKEKEEKEAWETRDGLSARVGTAIEHCTLEEWTSAAVFFGLTDAYILYFKELLSDNGGIFANAMGIGKTQAMVLAVLIGHVYFKNWTEVQNARAEGDAIEHNAVDDDDKLCSTKGERTFYCACERSLSFNVVAMDLANSTWCDLSDPLALRFCFFSDSPPENIGRLTKEEAIEMRIDTTNAISKALAAANKLVAPQSYVLEGAIKHCLALSAARFVIVCGFGKVDKHVFRAYNIISVTAQRTIIRKGGPYVEKRAILLPGHKAWALSGTPIEQGLNEILIFVSLALISLQNRKERDSVTGDRIYKMEDAVYRSIAETLSHRTRQNTALNGLAMAKQWRNMIANVKHDASEHESSHEFMLKRTLKTRNLWGKLISGIKGDFLPYFQSCLCSDFLSTAIASYSALATLKAAQFKTYGSCKVKRFTSNSVKDFFTNLSKDYFLVREARAITKSSLNRTWSIAAEDAAKAANTLPPPKEVCAKILIELYKLIVQAVTWLGLREKFGDESHEINLKLAKWRDLDGPWIIVALMAFAEAITLTEATHVLAEMCVGIVYFNPDSELELKVLGKQDVKITS